MIRTGAREATVECVFFLRNGGPLLDCLRGWGVEPAEELLIRRAINRNGRNRVYVNDQTVSLQQLQQLAKNLISISGQHDNQLLLDPSLHLDFVDAYGSLGDRREAVGRLFAKWSGAREEILKFRRLRDERQARSEYMRFQLNELETAKLQPGEDELLDRERNLLKHASVLMEAAEGSHRSLYADRGAVLGILSGVGKNLQTLNRIDPSLKPLEDHLEQAVIHLEELAHALQQYTNGISFDPRRLADVEERLALLQRLGKKHGGDVAAMLARLSELRSALGEDEDSPLREAQLEKALEARRAEYLEGAGALSLERREAAGRLNGEVEKVLASLDMPHARFRVLFEDDGKNDPENPPAFTPSGIDRIEFLLSANPGEALKPLARVASGGELSRMLLAVKSLLSLNGEAETLIFDEVDTGIGGRTAELVGLQLQRLAGRNQVICITHLPQIACFGKHHYKVAKQSAGGETATTIAPLSPEERIEELARMLGGVSISEKTREHAQEYLSRAQARRTPA
jgi:DNA repair protein RecN (Recombination protein N)